MHPILRSLIVLFFFGSVLFGTKANSQLAESEDRTLSPYFLVKSDDPQLDQLPLKSTSAVVNISGVIADVYITQVYKNQGKKPLEAIYVFPASTRAAIYGMKMTLDQRVIEAKISKREDARREYEKARDEGKSASLLEQQRPNVFQMNVANIMPGEEIKVELKYTELLEPTDNIYEFIYPTVVGPRYSNQSAETAPPSARWSQNPYLHQGEAPNYTFNLIVNIAAGMPLKEVQCTSHKVHITYNGPSMATVKLDPSEQLGGNRDYILRYRLDGSQIQSGLLLYEGERENFFLFMMQPPERVTKQEIPGREYIFIVDVSGSMNGFPLETSKKKKKNLIGNLLPTDRFNVLLFSGGSSLMAGTSLPATSENINRALQTIDRQQGGGGTEILPAFRRALALPKPEGFSRTIVIATDGYVTVEEEVFDLIRKNLGEANVFSFGIGTSVNRHIIEGMARVGMGEPFIITRPEEAHAKAERLRLLIQSPVLSQVKINFQDFTTYDVEPPSIPDILAERPVVVFGKWRGQPQGKIILSGISGKGPYRAVMDVRSAKPMKSNSAIRYLWARHRIALFSDYNMLRPNDQRIKEVTDLGLAYNLMTAYTSFVAVDTEVRNQNGQVTTVKQPLPLPQGVSDNAVGGILASQSFAPRMAKQAPAAFEARLAQDFQPAKKEAEKGSVQVETLTVSEGLSKEAILKIAQKNIRDIETCFLGSGLQGKLRIELTIQPNGKIKTVKILSSPFQDRRSEQCILEGIKKWIFPSFPESREGKVNLSFVFGNN